MQVPLLAAVPVLLLAPFCSAQIVSSIATASSAQVAVTAQGGGVTSNSLPPGVLPAVTNLDVTAVGGNSSVLVESYDTLFRIGVALNAVGGAASLDADAAIVVDFLATTTVPVEWSVTAQFGGLSSPAIPLVSIDVGADGLVEMPDVGGWANDFRTPAVLAPGQPLRLGIHVDAALSAQAFGTLAFDLHVRLLPANSLTITPAALGCAPAIAACSPSFLDRGVTFGYVPQPDPLVVVLGLAAQPFLLPSFQGLPCLAVPAPTFVRFDPSGLVEVGLPAAVRPVTFHAQGVLLHPAGLLPTDAFTVVAH